MADPKTLFFGALVGLVFGFLLQKGGLTRFRTIVGQFLFKDFTMLKTMITAMIVGGIGIYAMRAGGADVALHIKSTAVLGNVVGGLLFGVGMALLGYCPGTGVAALGDGSRHAWAGVLGMLGGAAIYAEAYPWVKANLLGIGAYGKVTLPGSTGVTEWLYFAVLLAAAVIGFRALRSFERRRQQPTAP
ncbi:MAG: YeeE/YedE thiosulfate transporter family protein [Planctomycetota bacterium]|nr:YeeE/YedE thiosulfate transporter family protein [Planctomycetota bacterium]